MYSGIHYKVRTEKEKLFYHPGSIKVKKPPVPGRLFSITNYLPTGRQANYDLISKIVDQYSIIQFIHPRSSILDPLSSIIYPPSSTY